MKRSRITSLRNFRRTEKFLTTAALAAAAASTVGLVNPASGATKTWLGTVVDTANAVNTTNLTYFTANSSLYKWDNSALNWTSGGAATTYAAGDDLVFNDNFNAGTLIEVNGTAQSPKSMTFAHVGPGVTNYNFLGGADFQNATGGNIGSSTPFAAGHTTVLTLQSGFNGTVAFRVNAGAGASGESITINGGTLELHTAGALPNSGNDNAPNVTLAGGELNVFVDLGGNVQPASSQLIGTLNVTANSVLANAAPNASRVWGQSGTNGTISLATGVTLAVESITGGSTNTAGIASALSVASAGTGTILLQDFNTGAGTYTTLAMSGNFSSGSANFDLGNGHSTLAASQATANLGALYGGANTTLAGASGTTFAVGSLAVTSTFNGNLSGGTLNKVGSTSVLNLAGVNTTTLALNANAGTLALSGANGTAQNATYNANGGTFKLDNSAGNNNDRLNDTTPMSLNQGSFEFVGNLASQTNEVAGPLTIAGATNVKTTDFGASGSATITFASLVRNNGIVNFNLDPNTHVRFQTAPVSAGAIIGGFATTNSFHDWVSLDANNNVIAFSNYNTNADPTTWNSTDVKVTAGSVGLTTSTTVNSVNFASVGGGTLVIPTGNSFTVTGGGMLANTNTTISGGGTLTAGDGTKPVELDLVVPDPTQTLTINSVIADNGGPTGAVSLLKAGPGTLVLGASNTFSGALAVAGGALSVNAANLLSPNGGLTVDLGTTFDLNGFGQNVATITLINGTIKNTPGGAAAMNVSGAINIQSGTLSANLTGPAALTKTSGNTVTLTGSNSYTGGTTVSNGNLNVNSTTALTGNATFSGGATNINSATTLGTVLGNGGTISGTSILTANSFEFTSGANTVSAPLAGANASVGVLKDADSNGSVLLSGANRFQGPVTIQNSGTLTITSLANGGVAGNLTTTAGSTTASFTGTGVVAGQTVLFNGNVPSGTTISSVGSGTVLLSAAASTSNSAATTFAVPNPLGVSSNAASNLMLDGGFLVYLTGGAASTDRLFTVTGNNGTIVSSSGNNAINFANTGSIGGGGILTLRGTSTGANTIAGSFGTDPNNRVFTIAKNDGGQWVLGQSSVFSEIRPNNGLLTMNVNQNVNVASFQGGTLGGTGILTVNNNFDAANGIDNVAVIGAATLQKDSGTFTINSTNSFTGGITIGGTGILNAAVLANGGSVSSIGQSSNADTNLVFNSTGTLSYIGAVATSTDRQFQLNANNAGFAANGVGSLATLTVANTFVLNDHSNTLNLGGANTGSNTFNPTIYGNGGLNKVDGGLWVLGSTANSFTGSVNLGVGAGGAGTLAVSSIADGGIQGPNINVTQGSNIATIDSTTGLVVGMTISASDQIAPGTTILAIGNGTITLSQPSPGNGGTSPNFGFANALGLSTGDGGNLNFGGGTLRYLGPTASTNRQLTIGTLGGGIDSSGTGPISFTNTASVNGVSPARTFTFSGTNTGSNTFAGQLADNGGTLGITKSGKGMWTLTGNNSYTGVTTVTSGTLSLAGAGAWAPSLTGAAGTALTGGRLVFDYSAAPASNPVNTIKTILTTGSAGSFTTGQIRTTNAGDLKHGIGFIDNGTNVTVGYTYYGDANVDGQVTTADFVALSSHFNATTGVTWANGDFNYDGKINALDFNLLATNFGAAAIAAPLPDAPALLGSLVPEPTSLALLGGVAAMGLRRRRRAAR